MTISSILGKASVAAVGVTTVLAFSVPAEAISIGSIGLSGTANLAGGSNAPDPLTITFPRGRIEFDQALGVFDALTEPPQVTIRDLILTQVGDTQVFSNGATRATYRSDEVEGFINFGRQLVDRDNDPMTSDVLGVLKFDLKPTQFERTFSSGTVSVDELFPDVLGGIFTLTDGTGKSVAKATGGIGITRSGDSNTFALTLEAEEFQPVPEPLTILGSLSALGVGTVLKKK